MAQARYRPPGSEERLNLRVFTTRPDTIFGATVRVHAVYVPCFVVFVYKVLYAVYVPCFVVVV